MHFSGIHHVSLNVDDLDAARSFYVEALGLRMLDRPDLGFPGLWLDAGGQEIHLLARNAGEPLDGQHFALAVTDLEAVRKALVDAGVTLSPTQTIPGICAQAFTKDPSGNLIEFNQRL